MKTSDQNAFFERLKMSKISKNKNTLFSFEQSKFDKFLTFYDNVHVQQKNLDTAK